jgi:putative phosphoesterase
VAFAAAAGVGRRAGCSRMKACGQVGLISTANDVVNIPARRIGLIADTHNLLRPAARSFLRGCDHIIHAGDICEASILQELATIAPVTAVRGNNDRGSWADYLQEIELLQLHQVLILVIHDLAQLKRSPLPAGVRVVISGHSHKPLVRETNGILYVNPGSAGPRRFKLPISVGEIVVEGGSVSARTVEL